MRPLWQRWPTILAIGFFLLNVDLILMPLAISLGLVHGWTLFWLATTAATLEPVYWNWYAKWLVRNVKQSERVLRVRNAYARENLGAQIRQFLEEKFEWFIEHARLHIDGDEATRELRDRAVAFIHGTHVLVTYPLMICLGLVPSGWALAIFIQRIYPVPAGFVLFLAANAVKTYALGLVFTWLPWWGKASVLMAAALVITLGVRRIISLVSAFGRATLNSLP